MPTQPAPITLALVVHRAVEACEDPDGGLDELLERFEDGAEPIAAVGDIESRLEWTVGPREDDDHPASTMFGAELPAPVARWLQDRGVAV